MLGGIDLDQFHTAHTLIVKCEVLPLALLDENALRGSIQHKAVCRLGLPCDDGSTGGKVGEDDLAVSVGDILPVAGAQGRARAVGNQEGNALQWFIVGPFDVFLDGKRGAGSIIKRQRLGREVPPGLSGDNAGQR